MYLARFPNRNSLPEKGPELMKKICNGKEAFPKSVEIPRYRKKPKTKKKTCDWLVDVYQKKKT